MPRLKMPGVDDLTPEQDRILRLPDEGRYFIGGPPGTGKTIIALLRAHAMTARDNRPNVVMHNRLLRNYCEQWLASRRLRLNVDTYHRWFSIHYHRAYGAYPPELRDAAGKPRRWWYDWGRIEEKVAAKPPQPSATPLLIDEGQDLPRSFYQYVSLHFANIMVFADENQMLDEKQNSTKEDIWAQLGIPQENRHMLKTNHRNTLEIALVAERFYVGTDAGKPERPARRGLIPHLVDYGSVGYMAGKVVRHACNRPHELIAVMTACNESQDAVRTQLEPLCREMETRFTWYRSNNGARINFDQAGIVLLNIQSVKGLEFDGVLIADLHEHYISRDSEAHKMRLYVATSRARDRLYIMYDRTHQCPLLKVIPGEDVLKRFTLKGKVTAP